MAKASSDKGTGAPTSGASEAAPAAPQAARQPSGSSLDLWTVVRVEGAQPCAAHEGTAQQETVDGEAEVFQVRRRGVACRLCDGGALC